MAYSGISVSRRGVVLGAMALAGCSAGRPKGAAPPATIEAAVAGAWRTPADRARDAFRHPVESLKFWGLQPRQTVVEFWPGAGWYTDIVAPYVTATGGRFIAADLTPADPDGQAMVQAYRRRLEASPGLYGKVSFAAFGPGSGAVAPAGTADLVLFLRNLHDWMAAGLAEKAFRDAFTALKPGGVLGIEEHRADPAATPDVMASSGYVPQAYAIQLAKEVGFELAAASEINANPKDHHDHPFGVWTLPPVRRSSPIGQPPDSKFDHTPYDAIGESDRMTLKLIKPVAAHA
ncbi:methyltransferase [Phenylobacterium sp.]|jgi:predicted methyltransferase|uniref:class I SAM-dependent methyltransferase n=1 Tax=Phenylobacterium sp. TaxID=1871053 RepID=UPI002E323E1F|nr:methyltransferase [Phenylobacterium sp.]HEX3365179.1 methyltransferase [Phenylobacterium sp.]